MTVENVMSEKPEPWEVVFRHGKPIAAFNIKGLAQQFIEQYPHRSKDTVSTRRIYFKGIQGYPKEK
jgi:hypothetical protein